MATVVNVFDLYNLFCMHFDIKRFGSFCFVKSTLLCTINCFINCHHLESMGVFAVKTKVNTSGWYVYKCGVIEVFLWSDTGVPVE